MKPLKKMQRKHAERIKAHEETLRRQSRNVFSPNASGPSHAQKKPGSMNKKKLGLA